jgi:hypothetical protein
LHREIDHGPKVRLSDECTPQPSDSVRQRIQMRQQRQGTLWKTAASSALDPEPFGWDIKPAAKENDSVNRAATSGSNSITCVPVLAGVE